MTCTVILDISENVIIMRFLMNQCSLKPGVLNLMEMTLESIIQMSEDFSSKQYNESSLSLEDSTVTAKFPLSIRWRETQIPVIYFIHFSTLPLLHWKFSQNIYPGTVFHNLIHSNILFVQSLHGKIFILL